jgi:two-component system nitrogen regulation response regulator GlnG
LWNEPEKEGDALLARQVLSFAPSTGGEARPLDDPYISRRAVRFTAARFGGIRIDCSESGTRVVANDDWIPEDRVFLGVEVERGVVLVLSERLVLLLHNLAAGHALELPQFGLVGESPRFHTLRREMQRLAASDEPALLRAAVGSGKQKVARAIHDSGKRQERPYVAVTMLEPASVPPVADLMAQAAGGTLVIDAVEKTPPELQREILEAIAAATPANSIRLLAATEEVGRRRLDGALGPLFEQIVQDVVDIPPLERRRDDVARLLFHFLREELAQLDALHCLDHPGAYAPPWFPVRLLARLVAYEWPRNILQLKGVTRHLATENYEKPYIDLGSDIEILLDGTAESSAEWEWPEESSDDGVREPADVSEIELLSALRTHRWQAEPTAAELGITPEALFVMIEKFSEGSRQQRGRGKGKG